MKQFTILKTNLLRTTFIAALAFCGLFGVNEMVWGNTLTVSGNGFNGKVSNNVATLGGNHVSFTFTGSTVEYSSTLKNVYLGSVGNNSSATYTFSWTHNSGSTLNITNIQVKGSATANGTMQLSGGSESSKGKSFDVSTTSISGNSATLTCRGKAGKVMGIGVPSLFYLTDIIITYTITPNKPGISTASKTVDVTLPANTATPTTVGYKVFTTADHFGDYWNYEFTANPNSKGVMSGDNFYATEAGTYKIRAKIDAVTNCHNESAWSDELTITVNRLNPTLSFEDGTVDVSVNSTTDKVTLNLDELKTYTGNGDVSYDFTEGKDHTNGTISGNEFYATEADKTYYITATSTQTGQYSGKTADFTVAVNKRTPTFSWAMTGENDHIYAGDVLSNVAQARYANNNVAGLTYNYTSGNTDVVVVDGTTLRVQSTGFTTAQTVRITVNTAETAHYLAGSAYHDYLIEPKQTPEFYMNGNAIPEENAELHLKIGETANFLFDKVDESKFSTPQNPQYVSYVHNSTNHTGVLTATTAGDETILFSQTGTNLINAGSRSVHVYVSRHPVSLATTLDGGTWKVDSVYTGAVYSITAGDGVHELNTVSITSSDESVLKYVDGGWKAVGAGEATLTITHPQTNYWAGETVYAHITVEKYTPTFTWHLPATVNWNRAFANPVSSTNTMEGCTFSFSSNNTSAINWTNNALRTFEKNANNVAITVTQAGNYKWAQYDSTFYVNVEKMANHVEFTVNSQALYNAVNGGGSGERTYDATSGIRLGGSSTLILPGQPCYNWDDKYVIINFEGIPDKLSFQYRTNKSDATGAEWFVKESADGANWSDNKWSNTRSATSYETVSNIQLSPNTRYLLLCYSGNFAGYYKDIKVTERTEITGENTVDFGEANASSDPTQKTTKINWYNVNPLTLTIEGTNASQFTVSPTSIASAKDNYAEKVALTLTYKHNRAAVKDTATLVITDGTTTKRIGLKGVTNKITPAITWKENLTPMQRGVGVKNPATSPVTLTYSSTDPTVVNVIGDSIVPLKKGEAQIIASFDGTSDPVYNSASSYIDVVVTDVKVQHINWPQTFTRLKYSTEKPEKTTADFGLSATVSYFDPDTREEISVDRTVTFTSGDNAVVQVLSGNILHVVGVGTTTLTAHVDGVENEFIEANVVRSVKVREPSTDCDTYILEDAHNSMLTEINSFSGVETVYDLNEEPGYLTFSAWTEKWYLGKLGFDPSGDLKVAQFIDGEWSEAIWSNGLQVGVEQSFGPIALDRRATKIKFYKEVGATCYHNFSEGYVTLARYVELDNTPNKTTSNIAFTTEETKPGVAVVKTFAVNYSNITDQLVIDYEGSDKFSVISPNSLTIGEECGDKGTANVQVQFLSNEVNHFEGVITIHNANQSVTINLTANVDKHHQQITWNPATDLKTTDEVTFDATTTGSAAGLSVTYHVTTGSDVAAVNDTTGELTIIKDGQVTIEARAAGNDHTYYAAEPVSKTFTISKVKASIKTPPTAETMTLPNTSLGECDLTGGETSVAGEFAWDDETIDATYNNSGYKVVFTPANTNWYDTASCVVVVPVDKIAQEITWNFNVTEMFCNATYAFTGANAATVNNNVGTVVYETSADSIAYVDDAKNLKIVKGGIVTITARCAGNELYADASPVAKTFIIHRMAPTIVTLPTAASMKIGRLLSDASLTGGRAELNGLTVEGNFAWENGNTTVEEVAGSFTRTIIFTPSNSNYYDAVSTTLTVVVEKYAPVITAELQGSQIEYGQALNNSYISGSIVAMDTVKITNQEVDGTFAWKDGSAIVNAGNPSYGKVVFTPANTDWYNEVEFDVPLIVTPAEVPTATATASLYFGQVLSEAVLTNTTAGLVSGIVNGVASWDESLDLSQYYTVGTHELPIRFTANDPNYQATEISGTAVLTVTAGYVFNGANGPSWGEDGNWTNNTKPGADDPVVIMADVVITTPITAGGITISNGVNVTVKNGGKLTLGDEDSFVRSGYGNLTIEAGGEVDLGEGKLKVNDFAIETTMASGKSGQLNGATASNFAAAGEAYIDITLGAAGKRAEQWHAFTVPFPVDALNGIFDAETGDKLVNEVNYAIMDYHGDIRATGKYGWKKYRKTLVPGTFYIMTVDGERTTYRFKKKAGAALIAENSKETFEYAKSGDGQDIDAGWNGIGNPTLQYGKVNVPVQVLDPEAYEYVTKTAGSTNFVVGTPFFYKAGADGSIMMQTADAGAYYAPARRTVREIKDVDITFGNEAYKDHLYISASEDALDSYEQDKDLVKMRMSKTPKVAQIMAKAYGCELSIVNAPMVNDEARYALSLYAPAAGEYTISSDAMALAEDGSQLYLTYNGYPIWNLTSSPMTVTLPKGNSTQFGLKIVRSNAMPTGIEEVTGYGLRVTGAEKMIMDGKLFILRDGVLYDGTGRRVW